MSGVEVKRQVMEALESHGAASELLGGCSCGKARAALASCVILTKGEAAEVIDALGPSYGGSRNDRALILLVGSLVGHSTASGA